jgi:hypothetical protein
MVFVNEKIFAAMNKIFSVIQKIFSIVTSYSLVIHCGACMLNRREMISRILRCREAGVPITNYGVAITYSLGVLDRALFPFSGF